MIPTLEYQLMNSSNNTQELFNGDQDTRQSPRLSLPDWPMLPCRPTLISMKMPLMATECTLSAMEQLWKPTKLDPTVSSFCPSEPTTEGQTKETHTQDASQQTDGLDARIMEAYQKGFSKGFADGFSMRLQQFKGSGATATPPPSVTSTMSDTERVQRDADTTPSPVTRKDVPSVTIKVSKAPMYAGTVEKTLPNTKVSRSPSPAPVPSVSTTTSRDTTVTSSYDPVTSWDNFPVAPEVLQEVLGQGFSAPVSIQQRVIVPIVRKHDVVMQAPAGAGKTLAFVMGMVQRWVEAKRSRNANVFAVIIVPGKLLAEQCAQCMKSIGGPLGMLHLVAVGGKTRVYENKRALKRGVDVVIGTPGRLEHLVREDAIRAYSLHMLIMDEVDTLLGENHLRNIHSIITKCSNDTQIVASSATLTEESIHDLQQIMSDPIVERVQDRQLNTSSVKHHYVHIDNQGKSEEWANNCKFYTCVDLLRKLPDAANTIVFVNRRSDAIYVHESLVEEGVPSLLLHGDMNSHESQEALAALTAGTCACLVATDVVARGIDLPGLNTVINFNLMRDIRYYLHRTGRVGRRGRGVGVSISLVNNSERALLLGNIAKTYGTELHELSDDVSGVYM